MSATDDMAQGGAGAAAATLPGGLVGVAEPLALRDGWWAAERAGTEPPDLVASVTGLAWDAWADQLDGVDATWLAAVAAGHRRELWLWLAGERTWEQALTGLAGRVRRRLPA